MVIGVLRVLIIPLWLMRDLEMMVGVGSWPGAVDLVIGFPFLFAPYVLADYILSRARATLFSSLRSHSPATQRTLQRTSARSKELG